MITSHESMTYKISDTIPMSSPSDDWTEFYQTNLSAGIDEVDPFVRASSSNMFPTGNHVSSSVAEATVVTTTIVSPTTTSSTSHQLLNNPAAGRVSKPTTRRRRASRCAPVTLLNTDTNNFRAMVQQFTGVTNAPFSIGGAQTNYNLPNLNFGLSSSSNIGRHPTVTTPLRPIYQYHHQQQQQQQQQQQFQMSSLNNNGVNPLEQISNNGFFMENNSSGNENRGGHDGGNGYILR